MGGERTKGTSPVTPPSGSPPFAFLLNRPRGPATVVGQGSSQRGCGRPRTTPVSSDPLPTSPSPAWVVSPEKPPDPSRSHRRGTNSSLLLLLGEGRTHPGAPVPSPPHDESFYSGGTGSKTGTSSNPDRGRGRAHGERDLQENQPGTHPRRPRPSPDTPGQERPASQERVRPRAPSKVSTSLTWSSIPVPTPVRGYRT